MHNAPHVLYALLPELTRTSGSNRTSNDCRIAILELGLAPLNAMLGGWHAWIQKAAHTEERIKRWRLCKRHGVTDLVEKLG